MNSVYSEPPDIVNFLPGPFEFTITRVHCSSKLNKEEANTNTKVHYSYHLPAHIPLSQIKDSCNVATIPCLGQT